MIFPGETRFREVEQEAFARSAAAYALFKKYTSLQFFAASTAPSQTGIMRLSFISFTDSPEFTSFSYANAQAEKVLP